MKLYKPLFALLILFIFSGCALMQAFTQVDSEAIVSGLDASKWTIGFQKDYGIGNGYIREWVPKGENINSWSQLVSIEFIEGVKKTPFDFSTDLATQRKQQCPGTEWSEIKRDQNTIYYKFIFPDCAGHKAQVEITRLFRGNDGLHRLSYAQKGTAMEKEDENYFLNKFDNAYVAKGSPENRLY